MGKVVKEDLGCASSSRRHQMRPRAKIKGMEREDNLGQGQAGAVTSDGGKGLVPSRCPGLSAPMDWRHFHTKDLGMATKWCHFPYSQGDSGDVEEREMEFLEQGWRHPRLSCA